MNGIRGDQVKYPVEGWYELHWRSKDTPEFGEWFDRVYGTVEMFGDSSDEIDTYWTRRAFALMGWIARAERIGE